MFTYRFVVLSAVSKESQATEDKDSLDHQLRSARRYGESMGGVFVREYRMDGFSRSGYYEFSEARKDIPPFDDLARAVPTKTFDVIILESYDRLGDLGFMLWNYLKPHRIQLRSVQQMLPIQDPEVYDPKRDDTTPTMINNSLNTNVYRIHKIDRAFEVGTKKRVESGYFARRVPYGYHRVDKYNVELIPRVAELLSKFPGWFLSGKSISKICDLANASGVTSAQGKAWRASPVIEILRSPFYAGKVYYERGNLRSGKYKLHSVVEVLDGKHEPMWTWETHLQIMDEFKRRSVNTVKRKSYNLSGILKCGECGHTLYVAYDRYKETRRYWRCPNNHVWVSAKKTEKLVADELMKLFASDAPVPNPEAPSVTDYAERELQALHRQMTRLEQAYETGAYTVEEFAAKRKTYKAREVELKDIERQKAEALRRDATRNETVLRMRDLIPVLPIWLVETDPAEVRYHLSRTVKIIMHADKHVTVELI